MRRTVFIPAHMLARIPLVCAWTGCEEECSGHPLPEGWISLATYRKNAQLGILNFRTDDVIRDAVLCPLHAADLESWLKPI